MDENRWDGFVIICDDSVIDKTMQEAIETWLDVNYPQYAWEVCDESYGEPEGTYGKNYGQSPQILGPTVRVPTKVDAMIMDALNAAIDAVNTPTNGEVMEQMNDRLLAHSKTICTPGCLGCMDRWQRGGI